MKNKGFTLLEMMIVITMLGVIAAIAIPILADKKMKTNPLQVINENVSKEPDTSIFKQLGVTTNKKYRVIITDHNGNKTEKIFVIVEE